MFSYASNPFRRFMASLVVSGLCTVATTATASNDVDALLDRIYDAQDIQRQLPVVALDNPPSRRVGIPAVFGWFVLAGAAVGAAVLAAWIMAVNLETLGRKPRKRHAGRNLRHSSPDPEPQAPGDWLEKADDRARQGRFAEAIHLLLLGVLGVVGRHDRTFAAETAREIARSHPGPRPERLRALVRASELVHFGGRPATQEQFEDCRRDAVEIDGAASPVPA